MRPAGCCLVINGFFMWKESYRIGIDLIDEQHMELFRMAEELMKTIAANADSNVFKETIDFLKKYVVYHFAAEEKYQESVSYCGIEEHRKLHRAFTAVVLEFENRLTASDYDIRIVKELAGMLTTWLIYHVADADQKIAKNLAVFEKPEQQSCILSIAASAVDALEKMAGLHAGDIKQTTDARPQIHGDILVDIGLTGDIAGHAYFSFTRELAFKLIEIMMFSIPEEVDELVCSALAEISNIASGNAATTLAGYGTVCDITPPAVLVDESKNGIFETVSMDTGIGDMTVAVWLD